MEELALVPAANNNLLTSSVWTMIVFGCPLLLLLTSKMDVVV